MARRPRAAGRSRALLGEVENWWRRREELVTVVYSVRTSEIVAMVKIEQMVAEMLGDSGQAVGQSCTLEGMAMEAGNSAGTAHDMSAERGILGAGALNLVEG